MHNDEAFVLKALEASASAYVLKESSSEDLVCAIRAAVAGRRFLSPPLSEQGIEEYRQKLRQSAAGVFKPERPRSLDLARKDRSPA